MRSSANIITFDSHQMSKVLLYIKANNFILVFVFQSIKVFSQSFYNIGGAWLK